MVEAINPYQAPQSSVESTDDQAYGDINIFSFKGRLGRLRFFVYGLVLTFVMQLISIPFGISMFTGNYGNPAIFNIITFIISIVSMIIGALWTIQRMHDINLSGWWYLIILLPMLFLVAYPAIIEFGPGTSPTTPDVMMPMGIGLGIVGIVIGIFFLALWFIPGSAGSNRFGPPPPPNSTAVKVIAWIFVGLIVLAILSAVLMPALISGMAPVN